MALMPPNLDDRTFQDIVDEAKTRIPAYFNGWTDHNVSDPGVTLIELFAWMTDMILYRQNQVPDRLTVKMMQLFGINLDEPKAAKTDITFELSSSLDNLAPPAENKNTVSIPASTEVATTQTEMQQSIIFSTDQDLTDLSSQIKKCSAASTSTVRCNFHTRCGPCARGAANIDAVFWQSYAG